MHMLATVRICHTAALRDTVETGIDVYNIGIASQKGGIPISNSQSNWTEVAERVKDLDQQPIVDVKCLACDLTKGAWASDLSRTRSRNQF